MNSWRARRRIQTCDAALPMTPLIDVVFLMLIFFLSTIAPTDIFALLNANVPALAEGGSRANLLRVEVTETGFAMNGKRVTGGELDELLSKLAAISTDQPVLIACSTASEHSRLVDVLDSCAKNGLKDLSIVTR